MARNSDEDRVAALASLGILDSQTNEYFDGVTRLAMTIFGMLRRAVGHVDAVSRTGSASTPAPPCSRATALPWAPCA